MRLQGIRTSAQDCGRYRNCLHSLWLFGNTIVQRKLLLGNRESLLEVCVMTGGRRSVVFPPEPEMRPSAIRPKRAPAKPEPRPAIVLLGYIGRDLRLLMGDVKNLPTSTVEYEERLRGMLATARSIEAAVLELIEDQGIA
jgi:hypothetical protein